MEGQENGRRRQITRHLGEALFEAVGLLMQQYLGVLPEREGGEEEKASRLFRTEAFPPAVQDSSAPDGAQVNPNFDMRRFRLLQDAAGKTERIRPEGAPRGSFPAGTEKSAEAERKRSAGENTASADDFPAAQTAAAEVSRRFETDARRYDAGFALY